MLKLRITYQNDKPHELQEALNIIEQQFDIVSRSREYKGRGLSKYNNVYLDVEINQKRSKEK